MAFITVRGGQVVSQNAKGFTLVESYKKADGDEIKTYYKVWTEEPVDANTSIDVSGIVSVRVSEYEGNTRAEIHINKPRIQISEKQNFTMPKPVETNRGQAYVIEANAPF
jgi:hypothetical protein